MPSVIQQFGRLFCGHQPLIDNLNSLINGYRAKLNQQAVEPPKPGIAVLSVDNAQVRTEIKDYQLLYGLLDSDYHYTRAEDWAEVFDYIYFRFDMPSYISQRFDCDDFAFLLKGLVSSFFGLNYFAVAIGTSPGGGHAFNIFRDEEGLICFEPQTGQYFPLGERGYVVEYVLL